MAAANPYAPGGTFGIGGVAGNNLYNLQNAQSNAPVPPATTQGNTPNTLTGLTYNPTTSTKPENVAQTNATATSNFGTQLGTSSMQQILDFLSGKSTGFNPYTGSTGSAMLTPQLQGIDQDTRTAINQTRAGLTNSGLQPTGTAYNSEIGNIATQGAKNKAQARTSLYAAGQDKGLQDLLSSAGLGNNASGSGIGDLLNLYGTQQGVHTGNENRTANTFQNILSTIAGFF